MSSTDIYTSTSLQPTENGTTTTPISSYTAPVANVSTISTTGTNNPLLTTYGTNIYSSTDDTSTTSCICYTYTVTQPSTGVTLTAGQIAGIFVSSFALGMIVTLLILGILWKRSKLVNKGLKRNRKTLDSSLIRTATYKKRQTSDINSLNDITVTSKFGNNYKSPEASNSNLPAYLELSSTNTESIYSNDVIPESLYSNDFFVASDNSNLTCTNDVNQNKSVFINTDSVKHFEDGRHHVVSMTRKNEDVYNHLGDSDEKKDNNTIYDHTKIGSYHQNACQPAYQDVTLTENKISEKGRDMDWNENNSINAGNNNQNGELYANVEEDNYFILERTGSFRDRSSVRTAITESVYFDLEPSEH